MAEQILEGTWEEILQHAEEFSGKRVRLMVLEKSSPPRQAEQPSVEERPLSELMEGLVGMIDSREPCPPPTRRRDAFGEGVIEKLRKQGLKLP